MSQTLQVADDFTKIYGQNTFKVGFEYQDVHFNTLQPAFSRGEFDFTGNFLGVPGQGGDNTGRGQLLVTPEATTVPNGISFVGGANQVQASNISKTYDVRSYFAGYLQDDLKVSPKLTLNLGLRYDYFSPIGEANGAQANFIPERSSEWRADLPDPGKWQGRQEPVFNGEQPGAGWKRLHRPARQGRHRA